MNRRTIAATFALALGLISAHGQLAITEAMSSAANTYTTNGVTNAVLQASDYWELSNFGTNDISLQDYLMADEGAGLGGASAAPFDGLTIHAGETILFVRDDGTGSTATTNTTEVQNWWGPSLNTGVVIRFYAPFGFSSSGDGVSLWDTSSNLVDSVHFDAATRGYAFTYDTNTGAFGVLSSVGVNGAFQAATTDDAGSPGVTAGPVPLQLTQEPTNLTAVSGSEAVFTVAAQGLPHPKYQWYFTNAFNVGGPLDGETGPTLTITNALSDNAGTYWVDVANGVESTNSTNVTLTVTAAPAAPTVLSISPDMVAYEGQSTTFTVLAQGNPSPSYQWKLNGTNVSNGSTNALVLAGLTTNDSGVYTVEISNGVLPNTNASVTLLVTPKPNLAITEVQSSEVSGSYTNTADWWELSNLGDFSVDLFGYRWDDSSANLGAAYTFTNHTVIHPGESIICVENITAEQFKEWWGVSNLPPALQIVTYVGNGLGLGSGASGDQVNLWNQAATDSGDSIGKVAFVALSQATIGRTFVRNPDTGIFTGNSATGLSTNGINGAFVAAQNGDIGSPGWVVDPMTLHITPNGTGFDLTWNSTVGRSYTVFYKNNVTDSSWSTLTNITATGTPTTVTDTTAPDTRVYRLGVTVY
jgi:hypothetical protein